MAAVRAYAGALAGEGGQPPRLVDVRKLLGGCRALGVR